MVSVSGTMTCLVNRPVGGSSLHTVVRTVPQANDDAYSLANPQKSARGSAQQSRQVARDPGRIAVGDEREGCRVGSPAVEAGTPAASIASRSSARLRERRRSCASTPSTGGGNIVVGKQLGACHPIGPPGVGTWVGDDVCSDRCHVAGVGQADLASPVEAEKVPVAEITGASARRFCMKALARSRV